MNKLLAIETSSEACSVALAVGDEVLSRDFVEPRRHAELLLPTVQELMAEGEMTLADLDAIAFGRGPGSFTSLRIGIGVVQGLAWGAELGVVPVSSLAALAQGAASSQDLQAGISIVAAMDARMGEVFAARFEVGNDGLVKLVGEEQVCPPGELMWPVDAPRVAVGNGFSRYEELEERTDRFEAVYTDLWPSAASLVTLARAWLENNAPLPAHQAQPLYVRDNVARKSSNQ